jgi:hypothetical protein
MKKLASILSIGVITMAVALAPAFAQQTQPQEGAGPAAIQPKSDVKTPASSQPGNAKNLPAKPGPDLKATAPAPSPKPAGDVKTEKPAPAKIGTDVKKDHAKKSSGKVASRKHAKTRVSNPGNHGKSGKSESTAPLTGK